MKPPGKKELDLCRSASLYLLFAGSYVANENHRCTELDFLALRSDELFMGNRKSVKLSLLISTETRSCLLSVCRADVVCYNNLVLSKRCINRRATIRFISPVVDRCFISGKVAHYSE